MLADRVYNKVSMRGFFAIIFIAILFLSVVTGHVIQNFFHNMEKKAVKSESISLKFIPTSTPTTTLSPTPSPSLSPSTNPAVILKKKLYTVAIFGDSMVDTMGENLEYLQKALVNKYPKTTFKLYNYGIGGQNVEQGLARFESSFVNRERNFPPIPTLNPDVLIIGSFAYNPFSTYDRNRHYSLLKELIAKTKSLSSRIYLLAEIAPLETGFGKGKNGVNMPEGTALEQAKHIIEQLDNVINLSVAEKISLINVYYNSRIDGAYGDPYLVNTDDGIHPSVAGHIFTAELTIDKIKFD